MSESYPPLSVYQRVRLAIRLFCGLRRHDFRIARTFVAMSYGGDPWFKRWFRFALWVAGQVTRDVPDAMRHTRFASEVSDVPFWLRDGNPFANHPWSSDPGASLPQTVDTVLIGCGLAGCAAAYHWGRHAPENRDLLALDMSDAASGSAGRNECLVVMGRYYAMVYETVLPYLDQVRSDLGVQQRQTLARQFAAQYCRACYRNADMIERTVRSEGFECDYAREGWVQARYQEQQASLAESVRMADESGFCDWSSIGPEEVAARSGMTVRHNAGFSRAAASFHPAKWCWALLESALRSPSVHHFSRTRVNGIQDQGEH